MKTFNKGSLELKKKMDLHNDENYLRLILESYYEFNHRTRLEVATILYKKFIAEYDVLEENIKRAIYSEVFIKLMQSLEDFAMLAMMFSSKKDPLTVFLNNSNPDFYKFYGEAKKGLSDNKILKIYGLETVPLLLKKGLIKREEKEDFEKELDILINGDDKIAGEKQRLKGIGKAYTENAMPGSNYKYRKSNVVNAYHNLKHGYKVLYPTELFKQLFIFEDDSLEVIEKYGQLKNLFPRLSKDLKPFENKKMLTVGAFNISKENLEALYVRIHPSVQLMKILSFFHLHKLKDITFPVRQIRFIIYKHKKGLPKHFEVCPCGSNIKYKKCHAKLEVDFEGLVYKSN